MNGYLLYNPNLVRGALHLDDLYLTSLYTFYSSIYI